MSWMGQRYSGSGEHEGDKEECLIMKKRMKKVCSLLLVSTLIFSAVGCRKKTEEPEKKKETKKTTVVQEKKNEPKEEEVKEEIPANQNLLTGIPDLTEGAIGKRPVAVMVNNVEKAMPQYGIAKADIIFEIPVEGDVTRFMALYGDYTTLPQICPIRSCRYYFPALALGFDAFYVNWGIDDSIADYLAALNLDQFDGMNNPGGLFARDQEKLNSGYALEHTAYFDGPKFAEYVQTNGIRTDLTEDKRDAAFPFYGLNEQIKPEGAACTNVQINFGAQSATFTYDEASKTYLKQINGNPQVDARENTQLAFTNVFVLETDISVRDEVGHKQLDWDGASDSVGYYISNGAVQKIHWMKDENNEWSRLRFVDESGAEIKLNRGKTYIALNYKNQATFQ